MAKQTINNGEDGDVVRGKINSNFTELYARGYSACQTFTAVIGSNTINLVTSVANSNYEVLFFSPDGVGCGQATNNAIASFKVQCNAVGTVIYLLNEKS